MIPAAQELRQAPALAARSQVLRVGLAMSLLIEDE